MPVTRHTFPAKRVCLSGCLNQACLSVFYITTTLTAIPSISVSTVISGPTWKRCAACLPPSSGALCQLVAAPRPLSVHCARARWRQPSWQSGLVETCRAGCRLATPLLAALGWLLGGWGAAGGRPPTLMSQARVHLQHPQHHQQQQQHTARSPPHRPSVCWCGCGTTRRCCLRLRASGHRCVCGADDRSCSRDLRVCCSKASRHMLCTQVCLASSLKPNHPAPNPSPH